LAQAFLSVCVVAIVGVIFVDAIDCYPVHVPSVNAMSSPTLGPSLSLLHDVLGLPEIAEPLARFMGVVACCQIHQLSSPSRDALGQLRMSLAKLWPPRIYVLGGHSGPRAPGQGSQQPTARVDGSLPALQSDPGDALSWEELPVMPVARMDGAATRVGGKICVVGGRGVEGVEALDTASCFSPSAGIWQALPALTTARYHCVAVGLGNDLYVAGGYSGDSEALDSIERLQLGRGPHLAMTEVNKWEAFTTMTSKLGHCAAAVLDSSSFVIAGGKDSGYRSVGSVEQLRAVPRGTSDAKPAWKTLASLITPRFACAAASVAGNLVIAGGISDGWSPLDLVELYDPMRDQWCQLPSLGRPRRDFALVSVAGSVYALGGVSSGGRCTATVERFAVATTEPAHDWEVTKSLLAPRCSCVAAAAWF